MGLVITPLERPRRFNPLAQPLEAPQKLGGRDLVWRFDGGDITSDGGALVLKKLEERTGIVRRFAACFTDYRSPQQIEHPLLDLVAQRVFGLALGYEDLNDHDELRRDPMLAVALGKDDVKGEQRRRAQDRGKALAGKSTLNRLELTAPGRTAGVPDRRDAADPRPGAARARCADRDRRAFHGDDDLQRVLLHPRAAPAGRARLLAAAGWPDIRPGCGHLRPGQPELAAGARPLAPG